MPQSRETAIARFGIVRTPNSLPPLDHTSIAQPRRHNKRSRACTWVVGRCGWHVAASQQCVAVWAPKTRCHQGTIRRRIPCLRRACGPSDRLRWRTARDMGRLIGSQRRAARCPSSPAPGVDRKPNRPGGRCTAVRRSGARQVALVAVRRQDLLRSGASWAFAAVADGATSPRKTHPSRRNAATAVALDIHRITRYSGHTLRCYVWREVTRRHVGAHGQQGSRRSVVSADDLGHPRAGRELRL